MVNVVNVIETQCIDDFFLQLEMKIVRNWKNISNELKILKKPEKKFEKIKYVEDNKIRKKTRFLWKK
jgi:hypothetical protein